MPEQGEPTEKQQFAALLAEAKAALAEISTIRTQVTENAKTSDELRKQIEVVSVSAKAILEDSGKLKAQSEENVKGSQEARKKTEENLSVCNGFAEESKRFRVQSEEQLKATEAARKKADDEATYASLAKVNTESHAKTVASYKGQADGEFTTLTTNRQKSEELVQAITVKKAASDQDAKVIEDSRKAIEQGAQSIIKAVEEGTAKLKEVNELKNTTASTAKEAQSQRDETLQARNKAEEGNKQVQQYSTQCGTQAAEILKARQNSLSQSAEIGTILEAAKTNQANLAKVLEHLTKSDAISSEHEERVAKLAGDLEALIKKVEGLLPGATSAGLASAFNAQKQRFGGPQRQWLIAFVLCIAGLLVVATPSFYHAAMGTVATSWGEIFRGLAMRLPIVIPLVWLGIYAGRNYMLSLRMEEEYAYKEAVSTAFEGYKREMEKIISADPHNPTPLTMLCSNILRAIAERPGRIYEGKQEDITVLNEVRATVGKMEELRQKAVAAE